MPLYQDIPLDQAIDYWLEALARAGALRHLPAESVPLTQANGRVTAASVWARISLPSFHSAAMDGYAVQANSTQTASPSRPLALSLGEQAVFVRTGDPIPLGYDALIPCEKVLLKKDEPQRIIIQHSVQPWQHIRIIGEDIVNTQLIVPVNHLLRPPDLGAIAASGHSEVRVYRRPRVAILPAGPNLVPPGTQLHPGEMIEFNSLVLAAMAEDWGAVSNCLRVPSDDRESLKQALSAALPDHDLIVINAGSSSATAQIIAELGEVVVQGIALRPGHSVILAHAQGKAVLGIPRYPVSAMLTFDRLARPLIRRWLGQDRVHRPQLQAMLTRELPSSLDQDELIRVTLGRVADRVIATPLSRGAGATMSMVQADGIVHIPRAAAKLMPGTLVEVELLRPAHVIEETIIHLGSHDLTLDLLADQLRRTHPSRFLRSEHVGSLNGLLALGRGEAHLASAHLLDPESGEYNLTYLRRHLAHMPLVVLDFVERTQGLIVAPGNPKNIRGLYDLTRPDITFVNRQAGSGTRVLLDYQLDHRGIDSEAIQGYTRTETTHLAVAAAVQSGAADCALGILAAARSLHLDFVPLFQEKYQLIIPQAIYESALLAPLLKTIRDSHFRQTVAALGGYDVSRMGEIALRLPASSS
ncbi:MAG: molybdopterin biosynthesis protein [Chloroflexi bacterium]|nr:molybdopterin biosynthesis protein [Chloroflexota bacterium]